MPYLAWGKGTLVLFRAGCLFAVGALAACDAEIPETPVPPAQINRALAIAPVPIDNIISDNIIVDNIIVDNISTCSVADCDDGDPCTTDTCNTRGACVHKTILCAASTCMDRVCSPKTGACVDSAARNEGGTCDDGNLCTGGDVCRAGTCTGAAIVCDDKNVCTGDSCDAATGKCLHPNVTDGKSCGDGNVCNGDEVCRTGVCSAGAALVCNDQKVCTDDTCDPSTGCKFTNNTAACDDGKACTYGERCAQGTCGGGTAVVCIDDTCNARTCNGTATCTATPKTGSLCNDSQDCTFADACNDQGRCTGQAITCTSDNTTIRACNNTNKCSEMPRTGAPCDDGNPCTKDDALRSDGVCTGTVYTCQTSACVSSNVCDGKGGCKVTPKADGTSCNADNSKCTPNDVCKAGACVADPTPVACVAKDCNTVACEPATGNCVYQPSSGGECGVTGCFTRGMCKAGVCSGQPKDCSAFNSECSEGICDAETGACLSGPKPNGTSCASSAACATGAVCAFGACELAPMTCPAATGPCLVATCDIKTGQCGQSPRAAGSPCDPGNGCITGATCTADGTCVGAPSPNGEPCTTTDGQLGLCAFGTCTLSGGGVPTGGTSGADAGTTTMPTGGTGGTNKSSGGGCGIAGPSAPAQALGLLFVAALLISRGFSLVRKRRARR